MHAYDGHRLLVMDFAPGHTFYDLGRPPDEAELASGRRAGGAAFTASTRARSPVLDSWAIANLVPLAGQVGDLLDPEQRRLVDGPSPSWPGSTSRPCPRRSSTPT